MVMAILTLETVAIFIAMKTKRLRRLIVHHTIIFFIKKTTADPTFVRFNLRIEEIYFNPRSYILLKQNQH